jgi:hypothetical protein
MISSVMVPHKCVAPSYTATGCGTLLCHTQLCRTRLSVPSCPHPLWRQLTKAESPTADFLLVWLKSSRSDPRRCAASQKCRPQVGVKLRSLCFYGRRLSRTVPAGCTGPTCQNSRGYPKSWRPRKFSPIPVKT